MLVFTELSYLLQLIGWSELAGDCPTQPNAYIQQLLLPSIAILKVLTA